MTLKQLLIEELIDIPTTNQLFHYTNVELLTKIMNSGYIKSNDNYPAKTLDKENVSEISTIRPTKDNEFNSIKKKDIESYNKKMKFLSPNVGKVKFILFRDRITKGVRGASIKPIAELPKNELKEIGKTKAKILAFNEGIPNFNSLSKDIDSFIKLRTAEEREKKMKILNLKYPKNEKNFDSLDSNLYNYYYHLKPSEKESEERVVFKHNNGKIPLDERFMKIELLPGSLEEMKFDNDFIKGILKYKNVFVKNSIYNELIEKLKKSQYKFGEKYEG